MGQIIIVSILSIIALIVMLVWQWLLMLKLINTKKADNEIVIKILQGVACDYRIRIVSSGHCDISEELLKNANNRCINLQNCRSNSDGTVKGIEFTDSGEYYYITFKVFGKVYLSYANNEIIALAKAIDKARDESRNIFGRSGSLDRYRIK